MSGGSVSGANLGSYIREAIQKSVGTDSAFESVSSDLTTLLNEGLSGIDNKEDALDLDATEIDTIIQKLKQDQNNSEHKKYADIIKHLETVKTTLEADPNANICDIADTSTTLKNELLERDTIDTAYTDDFKKLDLCHQKEILIKYANEDEDKLQDIFAKLDTADAEIILLDLSIDLHETNNQDKEKCESCFNKIVKNYLLSDKSKADDKVIGLTALIESNDITDSEIKDNLGNALKDAVANGEVSDILSDDSKTNVGTLKTKKPKKSTEQQDIDDFYKKFFDTSIDNILTSGKRENKSTEIKSQQKISSTLLRESGKTPVDMADQMIADGLTDPAHIITVMGNLPERYQLDFITQMLSALDADALNELFPLLMGQILILQSQGKIDDSDLENLFDSMDNSSNSDDLLGLLQDYGADIDDLSDISCLGDSKLRKEIMADWQDMMENDSTISLEEIDTMAAGGISGTASTTTNGTKTNGTTKTPSGVTTPPPASTGTASPTTTTAPPLPAPVVSPFESYGHGFTQGFVAATTGSMGMPAATPTITITGNNNTINL